ncbi:MAG: hypothetical protein ACR2MX_07160 [Cyclobacteriaceae bacterium]
MAAQIQRTCGLCTPRHSPYRWYVVPNYKMKKNDGVFSVSLISGLMPSDFSKQTEWVLLSQTEGNGEYQKVVINERDLDVSTLNECEHRDACAADPATMKNNILLK